MTPEALAARSAIESLRSGVPNRNAVVQLGTTQPEIKARFEEAMDAVASGQGTEPLAIAANFGAGKSHLLEYLQTLAERQQFVTSFVVVSPEMPLGNAHFVLKALAENAQAPERMGTALRALAPDLNTASPAFHDLRQWARDAGLDERFPALLHIYAEFRADPELRAQILDDFEGKSLPKSVIRQKLKELGELAAYDLTGQVKPALLAHDRLRLLARFYRACGCRGLVVLCDEVERIAKFSTNQRSAAYQELGWWSEIAAQEGSGILPVFAMTENFIQDFLLGGKRDALKFQSMNPSNALDSREERATRGIALLKEFLFLNSPTPQQEEEVKYRIKDIYERAYEMRVPQLPRNPLRTSIRSDIRRWITLWDLYRYDPSYIPAVQTEEIVFDSSDITDAEIPPDDETNE